MPNCQLMKMASSSSSKCSKYDVFLSFRGETRKTFTDNLYYTLKDHRFNVFLDEDELDRGEIITEELKQAIKDSRLAAIIFSSKYAESRWCLQELVEILACKTMVLPIFYNIKPTDVNPEKGDVKEAFRDHQIRFPEKVEAWKNALNDATTLAGEDFNVTDGHEGKFIRKIVDEITIKLKNTYLAVATNPVGIDSRVQEIGNYLDVGRSDDVRIIGISGMGGLGKTTVAKAVFNEYQDDFKGGSFLANVRDEKLLDSQNTLLSDLLRSGNRKVGRVDEGTKEIGKRFGNLRALVVIDDVDSEEQLDALAIKRESFGPGSRIVITTRNEHLLEPLNADKMCHIPTMNDEEALELLSWHAFSKNCPDEEYLQVSREVAGYCGGLPKALRTLGTYLRGERPSVWEVELDKWKKSRPHPKIYKNFKISYDGLPDDDVKSVFLDISCFFIGMNKDYVMKILDRDDRNTTIEIKKLQDQFLVTVDTEGNLMMHDLVRDTGREIVREKSPYIKGKRCRLWDHEDANYVLRTKTGREEIQGLTLDLSDRPKSSFKTEAFREMHGLRLLKLKGVKFTGHCEDLSEHLSKELRWLCWHEFPMEGIPRDFNQTNLVDINLSCSNIRVWEDSDVSLEKLKFLNLGYCNRLTRLPDFSKIPNLERLILEGCTILSKIHSVVRLINLKYLSLANCSLADHALPEDLGALSSLEVLDARGNGFNSLPILSRLYKLQTLHLNNCANLQEIPDLPTNLEILEANECIALERMPDFSKMSRIRELHLNHCAKLTEILGLDKALNTMTRIYMEGCTNLTAAFKISIFICANSNPLPRNKRVLEQLMKTFSSSSSSSSKIWKYDVYLSFQGEDTRRSFTDHLYFALKDAQVNVFVYDYEQEKEALLSKLIQAIEGSKIAVIVFSRRYAESRWCLDELAKIMECRRTRGQLVFPIFYDVDPSDVGNQTCSFATAFRKHEQRPQEEVKEKLQLWRNAVTEAANLAGVLVRDPDGYDGKFIREIVTEIIRVLDRSPCLEVAANLVGIDSRVQEISNYLDVGGSNDVRIIGIWGMGGAGKTTLAKAIFNKYQGMFEGKSFLQNKREKKLVKLQEQLLFDILKPTNIKVISVDQGIKEIEQRLGNLSVLVIVDGIDLVEQLEALAIKCDSFGAGSRIIITTRDEHLLKILAVDMIYKLPAMNREEALQLLSWHAFGRDYPNEGYFELARKSADYCGGLPLALAVLGSHLFGRSISEWKSALGNLKSHPHREILERLKISFDVLDDDLKAIFLDISCFFTGMNKDYVMTILDGCDLYPEVGIRILQERGLVTANDDFTLMMHDLLCDMGREIVRLESRDPGKRSRLWHHDDVIHVLRNKSGTEAVQGLTLDLQESDNASFSTEAFRNMQSLRLLKLNYVKLTGSYYNLSKELRWLCWHGFPLEAVPEDFDHPNIVAIDLSYSKLIRVWEDSDLWLEKLKFLNLSHSHYLTRSPDFSKIPNLEELILQDCKCLLDIDQSIGQLEKLVSVDLQGNSFCSLPSFSGISKLETLCLNNCTNLQEIPDLPTNLELLEADECIALEKMPDFSEMSRMRVLHLNHSPKLTEIPGLDKSLKSLTRIHMEGCTNLTADFRKKILQGWTSCGYGGIFLNGNYLPEWLRYFGGDEVSFVVPQSVSSNFEGLTLCCVYSSTKQPEDCPLGISVRNKTKRTALLAHITYASVPTFCDYEDHYLWQGQLSNNVLGWQEGDEIKIFVGPVGPGDNTAKVKQIAVDFVWDKFMKENMDDSHPDLYDFNPHQDCFAGDDDEARTSHEASDEILPSNILRSDSIDGDDDEAGPSNIDSSDENQTPKRGWWSFFSKILLLCCENKKL